ncbi:hypothetical protein PVAND_002152 [Polypedilum vanderplanki]|uniref:HAT C-terminal dimerisation domain-containing protein n=1 Tax=Polypedilum vanderplanki TaxID=319348 RepID=A0A9J6BQ50_POLVA|nr:hypothetical protein PVAND_002152 [Polypedilum vanderplanki]
MVESKSTSAVNIQESVSDKDQNIEDDKFVKYFDDFKEFLMSKPVAVRMKFRQIADDFKYNTIICELLLAIVTKVEKPLASMEDLVNCIPLKEEILSGISNSQLDEESSMRDEILLLTYYDEKEYSFKLFDSLKNERVKKLFYKFNVVTCSSASIERVYSATKHVLTSDRTNITSENFGRLLMLKLNKHEIFKKI